MSDVDERPRSTLPRQDAVIRRELRHDDVDAIVELHDRVYRSEYGADEDWLEGIRFAIEGAVRRGWPRERALGSVWLVDHDDVLSCSLALVLSALAWGTWTGSCSCRSCGAAGSAGS